MPDPARSSRSPFTIILLALLALAVALLIGWQIGKSDGTSEVKDQGSNTTTQPAEQAESKAVKSLVSYTLPDNWKEGNCPNIAEKVYVVPAGENHDCNASTVAPVSIYVDESKTTDCNQINPPNDVRKHICKSEFINGKKALRAETEFASGNSTKTFYIDIGEEVVKVEYSYSGEDTFDQGFETLAKSVRTKS